MSWSSARAATGGYLHPKKAQRILHAHGYTCHLCGHGDAHEVDHITPWAEWTCQDISVHDPTNLAPAHGAPCPTCGRSCHADKTKAEAARGRARAAKAKAARGRRPTEHHPGSITHM